MSVWEWLGSATDALKKKTPDVTPMTEVSPAVTTRARDVHECLPDDQLRGDVTRVARNLSDKSKKIRNCKKKDRPLSNESNAVDDGKKVGPAEGGRAKVFEAKAYKSKKIRNGKKKNSHLSNEESNVVNDGENIESTEECYSKGKKDKANKVHKNKRKRAFVSDGQSTEVSNGEETKPVIDGSKLKKDKSKRARKNKIKDNLVASKHSTLMNDGEEMQPDVKDFSERKKGKSKKAQKQRKASHSTVTETKSVKEVQEVAIADVYEISSGEDDDSKGMKKWIKEYHERRPGIKVLQEQIDDFITAYEEQEEQAKREKEASLAEEGWTVVVHHKGGMKTTDSESGVAVGSVAEAAVREKMAKKKNKDVGLDFYRFQRKEANRSEIMKLQSKFEEDKKRIQQLRAARKFRPY